MRQRALGDTGLNVSLIGLGTVKFGRNTGVKYPNAFELPSDQHIAELLKCAQNLGINLLDTAPAYGNSEERIGKLIKNSRKEWILATKVGEEFINGESFFNFTPEHTQMSVERSLKRLNTDYLDIVLVHSDGNDIYNIQHFGVLESLLELKKQGLIRVVGMSTKTIEGGLLALQKSDVVMVSYNPIYIDEQVVIAKAVELNKGVLIKKALASGHLQKIPGEDPVGASLKFIAREPGVGNIVIGTLDQDHLKQNVACLS